jgi:hypothetical protein
VFAGSVGVRIAHGKPYWRRLKARLYLAARGASKTKRGQKQGKCTESGEGAGDHWEHRHT